MTDCSSRWSWISFKAEVTRSEQEGIGAPDEEALFSSPVRSDERRLG
ncbi:hypothetical protein BC2926_51610 [Bacillus cereus]|nr:hypothetical protein BC2926_51610 [Bacillus cereus]